MVYERMRCWQTVGLRVCTNLFAFTTATRDSATPVRVQARELEQILVQILVQELESSRQQEKKSALSGGRWGPPVKY